MLRLLFVWPSNMNMQLWIWNHGKGLSFWQSSPPAIFMFCVCHSVVFWGAYMHTHITSYTYISFFATISRHFMIFPCCCPMDWRFRDPLNPNPKGQWPWQQQKMEDRRATHGERSASKAWYIPDVAVVPSCKFHLVDFHGKCYGKYTIDGCYANAHCSENLWSTWMILLSDSNHLQIYRHPACNKHCRKTHDSSASLSALGKLAATLLVIQFCSNWADWAKMGCQSPQIQPRAAGARAVPCNCLATMKFMSLKNASAGGSWADTLGHLNDAKDLG